MSERDPDISSKHAEDLRFDDWPVMQYETWEHWQVDDETPVEKPGNQRVDDVEWVGFADGSSGGAILFEPEESTIYRGDVDEENERVVLDERYGDDRADESDGSGDEGDELGQRIEAIGEEHGWTWLSSFAREHLEDEDVDEYRTRAGVEHDHSEFQQRNVLPDADPDAGFYGAHTFADASGREHMLERDFDVYVDDGSSPTVDVLERYLVAEPPMEKERQGDAEIVDQREYELAVDVDDAESGPAEAVDDSGWERQTEAKLEEWHEKHPTPPSGDGPVRAESSDGLARD